MTDSTLSSNWEEITLPNGKLARKYPDGSVRDEWGHMIGRHPAGHLITAENAREMQRRGSASRTRNFQKATARGITRAAKSENLWEAVALIMQKRAEVALTDGGRAGNDAAKLLLMVLDALPKKEDPKTIVHEHTISDETMKFMEEIEAKRQELDRNIIDGDVK